MTKPKTSLLTRVPKIIAIIGGVVGLAASVKVGAHILGFSSIIDTEGIAYTLGAIVGTIARNIVDGNIFFISGMIASIIAIVCGIKSKKNILIASIGLAIATLLTCVTFAFFNALSLISAILLLIATILLFIQKKKSIEWKYFIGDMILIILIVDVENDEKRISLQKNVIRVILRIILPLFIGAFIYILFRPPLSWFPNVYGWDKAIIDLSSLPSFITSFILYHLTDVLWALSFTETLYLVSKNKYLAITIVFILTVLFELGQHYSIFPGTGDIRDVFFVTILLIIYLIIALRKDNKHEKDR